jgi:hypothetical protein
MPGTEIARKQHALGGAAGIAVLAFALVYRFFPGILHAFGQRLERCFRAHRNCPVLGVRTPTPDDRAGALILAGQALPAEG